MIHFNTPPLGSFCSKNNHSGAVPRSGAAGAPSVHTTRSTGLASDDDMVQYTDALARRTRNSKGWQLLLGPGTGFRLTGP